MNSLLQLDTYLTLCVNGFHSSFWDQFFFLFSKTTVWIPLYLAFIVLLFKKMGKSAIWVILALILSVVIADQISSSLFKPLVERLRPSHEPTLLGQIHLVNGYVGGMYGFVSSHAANTAAIALFISLCFRDRWTTIALISWTLLSSYSRVYLGVHYVGDVVCGTIVGLLAAWLCYTIYNRYQPKASLNLATTPQKVGIHSLINYLPTTVYLLLIVVMLIISVR